MENALARSVLSALYCTISHCCVWCMLDGEMRLQCATLLCQVCVMSLAEMYVCNERAALEDVGTTTEPRARSTAVFRSTNKLKRKAEPQRKPDLA